MIENLLPIVKDIGISAAVDRICLIILALLFIAALFVLSYIRYRYEKKIERLDSRLYYYIGQYHDCKNQLSALKEENSYLFREGYAVININNLNEELEKRFHDNVDMDTGESCNNWVVDMQNDMICDFIHLVNSNIVYVSDQQSDHLQKGDDDTCYSWE